MSTDAPVRPAPTSGGGPPGSLGSSSTTTGFNGPTEPAAPRAGSPDPRATLASQQRDLVDALTSRTGAPESFDSARVHLARRMLARKRCHGVEKAWPALIGALGERWIETYAEYSMNHLLPAGGGPVEDGLAFARFLRSAGKLPADALAALLLAEVRRGVPLRAGISSAPRRLVVAVRAAGWTRVLVVPLNFSRPFRTAPR